MIEFLNAFLLLLGFLLMVILFLYSGPQEEAVFVKISTVFMVAFFLAPAALFFLKGGMAYAGRFHALNNCEMLKSIISFFFFLAGFVFAVRLKARSRENFLPCNSRVKQKSQFYYASTRRVIFLAAFVLVTLIVKGALFPEVSVMYDVRRGSAQISPILLLLSYFSQAISMSLLFIFIGRRWRIAAISLFVALIAMQLNASSGRTTMALLLAVFLIYIFRIRANFAASFLPVVVFIGMPVILVGKQIIFEFSVNRSFPSWELIASSLDDGAFLFFQNFSHPFMSLYDVDGLVQLVGFRGFYDLIQGFLFYFRAVGFDFGDSLTYYNTANLLGRQESIIPTGYLAFGYVQASFFGVFVMGVIFRLCFRFVAASAIFKVSKSDCLVFYLSFSAANTFYTGEMRTMIIGFFFPVIVMGMAGKFVQRNFELS